MSQVSYGTITITDTTDKTVYIAYASNAQGADFSPNPSANLQYVGINISTLTSMPSADDPNWVWSKYAGTDGVSVRSVTEIYQLRDDNVTPTKRSDGTALPTAVDTLNTWSLKVPPYVTGGIYWTSTAVTMSASPTPIYTTPVKDEGLTDANKNAAIANSIATHANEDAQGAMSQAASNVNSVTRLWYARATAPSTSNPAPTAPTTQITTEVAHDGWSITRPADDEAYPYYFYCDQKITGGGVISCGPVTLDTSTLSKYEIEATNVRTKNFFKGLDASYTGWFVSGRSDDEGLKTNDAETYRYNTRLAANGITLGYNKTPVVDINGSGHIDIFRLPEINEDDENKKVIKRGTLGMKLTATSLMFYDSNETWIASFGSSIRLGMNTSSVTIGSATSNNYNTYIDTQGLYLRTGTTAYATLNGNGLILSKGGIESGNLTSGNGYVYLSTEDKTGITINGHNPGTNDPKWRAVIGSKFGVDSEGNLYANNAHLSSATVEGAITATKLTISGGGATYDGASAINANGYTIEIIEDKTVAPTGSVITENQTYLYPVMYLNGVAVTTGITKANYVWYTNENTATTGGVAGDSTNGGIIATYGNTYRVTYNLSDDAVGTTPSQQTIHTSDARHITDISSSGITIHPEDGTAGNYMQLDSDGLKIYKSSTLLANYGTTVTIGSSSGKNVYIDSNGVQIRDSATSLAEFGTTARIGQSTSSRFLMNSDSLQAYNSSGTQYFEVSSNGLTWGSGNTAATTTQVNTAAQTATNFIKTDGTGIKVQNSTDATNYVHIGSDGIQIYKNAIPIASFQDSVTLGNSSLAHNIITPTSFDFYIGQDTKIVSITAQEVNEYYEGDRDTYYKTEMLTNGDDFEKNPAIHLRTNYKNSYSELHLRNRDVASSSNKSRAMASLKTYDNIDTGWSYSTLDYNPSGFRMETNSLINEHLLECGIYGGNSINNSNNSISMLIGSNQTAYTSIDIEANLGAVGNISFSCSHLYSDVALTVTSDKRLKQHKAFLAEDANKFIRQLKPARFIRNGEEHLGFYAQDVEEANEWNVELTPYIKDYKGLTYTEIIAPLVAYCQHLEKRIDDLESQSKGGKE